MQHIDWLTLTGPKGWLDQADQRQWRALQHGPAGPHSTPQGWIRSPVLVVGPDGQTTPVAELLCEGYGRGKQQIWCPQWLAREVCGWVGESYGVPTLDLSGQLLRKLGWRSAWCTAAECWSRLCGAPACNVSRVDTAVEYGVRDFERLRRKTLNLALRDVQLSAWAFYERQRGRRVLTIGEQITDDGETYQLWWGADHRLQAYHKRGQGVRVELQVRRPGRPKLRKKPAFAGGVLVGAEKEAPRPDQQVWAAVQQGAELFSWLQLPCHREEPEVQITGSGVVEFDGIGTTRQPVLTQLRRGIGLVRSVARADEVLLGEVDRLAFKLEQMISQRFPERPAGKFQTVEQLEAHWRTKWAEEDSGDVG